MLVLDLFCGAGLAADGYRRAGWDVVGVDIEAQPHYPGPTLRADALTVLLGPSPAQFDLIHASPPCQPHTRAKHLRKAQGHRLSTTDPLSLTLALLRRRWADMPWVVENVPGAPGMDGSVLMCGSAYGLEVRRHRLFLSNVSLVGSGCFHDQQGRPWGVYHRTRDDIPGGGRTVRSVGQGRRVMGVRRALPWDSIVEGFPPAYTHDLGGQIADHLGAHDSMQAQPLTRLVSEHDRGPAQLADRRDI